VRACPTCMVRAANASSLAQMADHIPPTDSSPARSFGSVAGAYDRARPSYPAEAVEWLTGSALQVLELGAGTGKLTAQLVALDHDVYATDPDEKMLAGVRLRLPDVPTAVAPAEKIPLPDACMDVIVCAQSFHWFDLEQALPEIHRVLIPGGKLGLVWNERDERIPWVRRLGRLIGTVEQLREPGGPLVDSGLFHAVEKESFNNWQQLNRETLQDLVLSRSAIAALDDAERAAKRAEASAFYDEFERGIDGLRLPYVTRCFRATALILDRGDDDRSENVADDTHPAMPDDEPPLIDFR
jgi:SAM-dependent methyltransferase